MAKSQLSEELKRHLEIINYTDKIGGRQTIEEKFKITFQEQEPEEEEPTDDVEVEDEVSPEGGELDDMDYPIEFQGQSRQQYKINEDGSVSFLSNSMFNQVNRVEALFHGSPKNIVLKKTIQV